MSRLSTFLFDGQYKNKKPVRIGGEPSRIRDRDEFLNLVRSQRQERHADKRRLWAAEKIKAFWKSCKIRQSWKSSLRDEFAATCIRDRNPSVTTVHMQLKRFTFFYSLAIESDWSKLTWMCQHLISPSVHTGILNMQDGPWLLGYFLSNCTRYLAHTCLSQPIAMPMRMLELLLNVDQSLVPQDNLLHMMFVLVSKGYYGPLRILFDKKLPLDVVAVSQLPIATSMLNFICRPIVITGSSLKRNIANLVLVSFARYFLCNALSPPIVNFLLPKLAEWKELPRDALLAGLMDPIATTSDIMTTSLSLKVPSTLDLLYCILKLFSNQYLDNLLLFLSVCVPNAYESTLKLAAELSEESDQDDLNKPCDMEVDNNDLTASSLSNMCLSLLNDDALVKSLSHAIDNSCSSIVLSRSLARLCYATMQLRKIGKQPRLLYKLSFMPKFVRSVWEDLSNAQVSSLTGERKLLEQLRKGFSISRAERDIIIPQLSVFCSLFSNTLLAVHDAEFYESDSTSETSVVPFSFHELAELCGQLRDIALGLVDLAFPEARPDLGENYKDLLIHYGSTQDPAETRQWQLLFETTVHLLGLLYERDVRIKFCAPGSWCCGRPISILNRKAFRHNRQRGQLFSVWRRLSRKELEEEGAPIAASELRSLTILRRLPFVVPFEDRVKIFQQAVQQDKDESGIPGYFGGFHHQRGINITARRNYLYEDSFEKLSQKKAPNLRLPLRVHMLNWAGLDEAGIDGGGIFREFLSELLTSGFDPNRGFFLLTPHEKLLYPNPAATTIFDDYREHYFFLGRMLGKLLYENLLAEIPFASFFLSKMLSKQSSDVDINHLASLDAVLYKNLLYLKRYEGDARDLDLDFSVVVEELGQIKKIDLKENGREILVDNYSKIEYVHLVANFYLNKQIKNQTEWFLKGLSDLLDLDWLGMFDHRELQIMISGANTGINIDDMRAYTFYSGGYTEDHQVIQMFWAVMLEFTDEQRRKLLKFVTSCSRPPLLGFKDLYPPFNIQMVADPDRLPTAATCMNLFKLPVCADIETMRRKLAYVLESGAGFELS